jgi:hypothetical protein
VTLDIQNTQPTTADQIDDDLPIIVRYVTAGHLDDEVVRISDYKNRFWMRMPGESEQELIDRATREMPRNANGIDILYAHGSAH